MKMTSTIYGMIVPHSPTILEDELDRRETPVIAALRGAGRRLKEWGVEVVVAVSTHWQTGEKFYIDASPEHKTVTDYYGFRREIEYDVPGHPELAERLRQAGEQNLIFPAVRRHGADHAVTIPLHFLFPEKDVPVVPLSVAGPPLSAFRWGRILGNELREWGGKTLLMASGSLAHDLAFFGSGRTRPEHEQFDRQVLDLLARGEGMGTLELNPGLVAAAKPEGEFCDLAILLGAMGARSIGRVSAYERLPGVGVGVIEFPEAAGEAGFREAAGSPMMAAVSH